jgi:hypothetical protein
MSRPILLVAALAASGGTRPPDLPFEKITLDLGANETCAFADMNRDGKLDIVSGENWYEAPTWKKHSFRELPYSNNYIDAFSDLPMDVDGDGYPDIVSVSWFSRSINLWKNPGRTRRTWAPVPIEEGFNVEFAFLVDIDNDGKAQEVLPQFGNKNAPLAWYDLKDMSGGKPKKHIVAPQSYGHGIGAGDVNGDGKTDILTPLGWFERTADGWKWHGDWEGDKPKSLGFIHVIDIDGDGRNDILTSNAHDYGIFWLKNLGDGKWQENMIDNSWSQAHATTLADLNGDGQLDLVTGKRYMAHNGRDPGEREPLGIYWYEYRRVNGRIEWARHVVDYSTRAGGGMQIPVADIDGDGDMDFATAGKSGLFLFVNKTK